MMSPSDMSHVDTHEDAIAEAVRNSSCIAELFGRGMVEDAARCAEVAAQWRSDRWGSASLPVARALSDLAVVRAAQERHGEAMVLLDQAIAIVEQHEGDESMNLEVLLENAAAIAVNAGDIARAEPLVLRLHALLGERGLDTSRADALFASIVANRGSMDDVSDIPSAVDDLTLDLVEMHGDTGANDLLDAPIGELPELQMAAVSDIAEVPEELAAPSVPEVREDPRVREVRDVPQVSEVREVRRPRRPSRDVPVVMPSPAMSQVAIADFAEETNEAPRNTLHTPLSVSSNVLSNSTANVQSQANRSVLQDRPRIRASGGARVWLVVGGGLTALVGAVGYFLMQRGGA